MESLKGILEGPEYQAELPQIKPKPPAGSKPSEEEAVWLEHRTFKRGAFGSADSAVPITVLPCEDDGERWASLHGDGHRMAAAFMHSRFFRRQRACMAG